MKKIDISYLQKKINKLNKKIHRAESQNEENKVWETWCPEDRDLFFLDRNGFFNT